MVKKKVGDEKVTCSRVIYIFFSSMYNDGFVFSVRILSASVIHVVVLNLKLTKTCA